MINAFKDIQRAKAIMKISNMIPISCTLMQMTQHIVTIVWYTHLTLDKSECMNIPNINNNPNRPHVDRSIISSVT